MKPTFRCWACVLVATTVAALTLLSSPSLYAADVAELVAGEVEKVWGEGKFTEGPAWHPDGFLLFTDIPNERVVKIAADGTASDWWTGTGRANGLMCDAEGNVYACQGGAGAIVRLRSVEAGPEIITKGYDEQRYNSPNDLALDDKGGLYFTDPLYGQGEQAQPVQGVYYVNEAGETSRIIKDLPRPNGVLVSSDGKHLIVANPNVRQVHKYDIIAPGKISNGRVIFTGDEQQDGHGPDGMAFDEQGNIYATYSSLVILDGEGSLIERVTIPENPSNCAFGGKDNKTLFVTARTSLYKIPMKVAGQKLRAGGPIGEEVAVADDASAPATKPVAKNPVAKNKVETIEVQARDLTLHIPKTWKESPPANRLRLAQYTVPAPKDDQSPSEFVVFPPFSGTAAANIQRWIGQFDAGDREIKMTKGTAEQGEYILVDITGTYNKPDGPPILRKFKATPGQRKVSVLFTAKSGGNYFLTLTGADEAIEPQVANFRGTFGGDASQEEKYTLEN